MIISLAPSNISYTWNTHWHEDWAGVMNPLSQGPRMPLNPGETIVGFQHATSTLCYVNTVFRGLVRFDISSIKEPPVYSTLRFQVSRSNYTPGLSHGQ